MRKRWRILPHDAEQIRKLEQALQVPPVVAQLLIGRGLTDPEAARAFLSPRLADLHDPNELPGVAEAADRLHRAIGQGERIVVYGDYDVDGMTGTAILWRCLRLLGGDVGYYVPHRLEEGYGLHAEALEELAQQGTRVVVTVDCGISAVDEARRARELGLELIVSDHHELASQLPEAVAVVHPRLPESRYAFGQLSGAGVAFKLAWAVCQRASQAKRVSPRMRDFLVQSVALAALGTVADMVPLVDENRVLVRHGLKSLSEQPTLGLKMLMRLAQLDGKRELASEDIAFAIAPRLNAAGRLGQAQLAVELLVTDSPQRAEALAEYLHQLNDSRQSLEQSIYLAARKQAVEQYDPEGDAALVLAARGWHAGVIGIVAGRLAQRFHRPVVLLSLDTLGVKPAVGSARSIPGFDVHKALAACADYVLSYGGHRAAAGVKIEEDMIDAFRVAFCEQAAEAIGPDQRVGELVIDAEVPLGALTNRTVGQIDMLAPFGQGNHRPVVCASNVRLASEPQRMGGGGRHLSLHVVQDGVRMRAVAFGQGDWADELTAHEGPLDIAFRPVINAFRGRHTVELHLIDYRPLEAEAVVQR